jgi:hypothetical protein
LAQQMCYWDLLLAPSHEKLVLPLHEQAPFLRQCADQRAALMTGAGPGTFPLETQQVTVGQTASKLADRFVTGRLMVAAKPRFVFLSILTALHQARKEKHCEQIISYAVAILFCPFLPQGLQPTPVTHNHHNTHSNSLTCRPPRTSVPLLGRASRTAAACSR